MFVTIKFNPTIFINLNLLLNAFKYKLTSTAREQNNIIQVRPTKGKENAESIKSNVKLK